LGYFFTVKFKKFEFISLSIFLIAYFSKALQQIHKQFIKTKIMKKLLITLLCFPIVCFGQFTDNFSDGDFTNNPNWIGDVGNFEVDTNNALHLNDNVANTSYLSTPSQAIVNGSWEFSVRLDFSPSQNNYARVYLVSDTSDLSGLLNGVYVKIGGQSGSIDDISLYTQSGTNHNEIIDGVDSLATNNPDIRVRVTVDAVGNWELFLDTNGVFFTQGTVFDNSLTSSSFFGVYCKYTVTRSDKFWFDDFTVTGSSSILGCIDSLACNYNSTATFDDGSCLTAWGCMNATACNYDASATCDDGFCDLPDGCGDPLYVEYDPLVTCSDPTACITLIVSGIETYNISDKKLLKVTDLLGRETKGTKNEVLFYIYDDGTVEKRIVID
jgi:hypothetical protein